VSDASRRCCLDFRLDFISIPGTEMLSLPKSAVIDVTSRRWISTGLGLNFLSRYIGEPILPMPTVGEIR